ncbi:MAG: mechanosensitive ion channel family protein [Bacteroidales bacterium]|nr:mechanosensitive ion channel family protein [Bacteroidales bacterium]MBP5613006.1 mechanosensitive ion channel family protein [Bacteroidales bacterium]
MLQAIESTPVVPKELATADSIRATLHDSLTNIRNLSDVKEVITGQNPIVKDAMTSIIDLTAKFVPKLITAILVLWIGFKLIKMLKKALTKLMEKQKLEMSLKSFLTSFLDVVLKILVIIMVMDIVGIKVTSFIAIVGAAGLAIGMALQGTLQNFAGGVIILLLKPFRVGDYIECKTYKGFVRDIRIFHTIMQPFNGRTIIVPNSELATTSLINHTREPQIRLDVEASVAYGTDLAFAKQVLEQVVNDDPMILKDPIPKIAVKELNNSSVDFALWLWVKTEDYWTVWMRIRENIYNALYANHIEIPFPQVRVHTS